MTIYKGGYEGGRGGVRYARRVPPADHGGVSK